MSSAHQDLQKWPIFGDLGVLVTLLSLINLTLTPVADHMNGMRFQCGAGNAQGLLSFPQCIYVKRGLHQSSKQP